MKAKPAAADAPAKIERVSGGSVATPVVKNGLPVIDTERYLVSNLFVQG